MCPPQHAVRAGPFASLQSLDLICINRSSQTLCRQPQSTRPATVVCESFCERCALGSARWWGLLGMGIGRPAPPFGRAGPMPIRSVCSTEPDCRSGPVRTRDLRRKVDRNLRHHVVTGAEDRASVVRTALGLRSCPMVGHLPPAPPSAFWLPTTGSARDVVPGHLMRPSDSRAIPSNLPQGGRGE